MKASSLIFLILFLFCCLVARGTELSKSNYGGNESSKLSNPEGISENSFSENIQIRIKDICTALNVEGLFTHIKVANSNDSESIISSSINSSGDKNYYDQISLNLPMLNSLVHGKESQEIALNFCLAHEISHFKAIHTVSEVGGKSPYNSYFQELECDKDAGLAIAVINENTQGSILDNVLPEFLDKAQDTPSHPPVVARIMSAKSGWIRQKLHDDINYQVAGRTYNPKTKKYKLEMANPSDRYKILTNNRFLIELNTFEDNIISFKIMDFRDGAISYIEVKPKLQSIVKGEDIAENDGDPTFANFYKFGNDMSLYSAARFIYKVIPEKEYESTESSFVFHHVKYVLKYGISGNDHYISLTDPAKTIFTVNSGGK